MRNRLISKIQNQIGESISEVLIALLISSIALVMLASMISATNSMVGKSKSKMEEYYSQNENLEQISAAHGSASTVTISIRETSGASIQIPPTSVPYAVNDVLGADVYAYDSR